MSTAYAAADDVDINDPRLEQEEDLSGETSDVLPKALKVRSTIKSAKIRTQLEDNQKPEGDDNKWKAIWMSLGLQIGDLGIDGEGAFAGRTVFTDLCIKVNRDDFPKLAESTYYSRSPYTQFLRALGYDLNPAPVNTTEFREGLIGREVVHDIFQKAIQDKVGEDWVDTGDFKNVIKNYRSAE